MEDVASHAITPEGRKDYVTPRALETEEIPSIIENYKIATKNALAAGFDVVELHAANGYLLEQFLCDKTNKRTDKLQTYGYVVKKLSDYNLAYLHVVEPFGWEVTDDLVPEGGISPVFRPMYNGPLIATGGFDRAKAIKVVEDGTDDMIGFGRDFIGTPDLVERLKLNKPFNEYNQKTFYVCFDTPVDSYPTGYTDYPSISERSEVKHFWHF